MAPTDDRPATGTRIDLHIPWRTFLKVILAAFLVWVALRLRPAFTVLLVATVLAVALDPVVVWLERHKIPRAAGVLVLLAGVLVIVGGALAIAWSSLASQGQVALARAITVEQDLVSRFPILNELLQSQSRSSGVSMLAARGVQAVNLLTSGAIVLVFGLILTVYLLLEGRQTYQWIRGYLPRRQWAKLDASAEDARRVIGGYVAGNAATSVFAALFVFGGLTWLKVPAALVLALLAGVCDFVPVLGFVLSVVPAVILALMVSPATALGVTALFVLVHAIENYLIGPYVYGNRLRLSNLAVLLALAVGAEVGGVVGALVALPIAAAYSSIERIWLADYLGPAVVAEHQRLEQTT